MPLRLADASARGMSLPERASVLECGGAAPLSLRLREPRSLFPAMLVIGAPLKAPQQRAHSKTWRRFEALFQSARAARRAISPISYWGLYPSVSPGNVS